MQVNMQKNEMKDTNRAQVVGAVVTGAVVGAGVAVAGAVALSDKKNRQKVKQAFVSVKDRAVEYAKSMQENAMNRASTLTKDIATKQKGLKKAARVVKKKSKKTVEKA